MWCKKCEQEFPRRRGKKKKVEKMRIAEGIEKFKVLK